MHRALLLLALSWGLWACDEQPETTAKKVPDAASAHPGVDPNLAKAMASAQAQPAPGSGQPGPPTNGVFAPGEADRALPPGTPLKIEMINSGSGQKLSLTPSLDLSKGAKLRITVQRVIPAGVMPNVEFRMSVKTPAEDAEGDKNIITFTVNEAVPAEEQPGQAPKEFADLIKPLKGLTITAKLAADGSLSDEKMVIPEGVQQPIDQFAHGLLDVLGMYFSPLPSEPVGVGAYWMGADRAAFGGMKLVRYRVTKIDKLIGDELALSVDVRMYAIDATQMPSIAEGEAITQGFATNGKASWTMKRGSLLPTSGQLKLPVVVQLVAKQDPSQVLPLQFETTATVLPPLEKKP